MKPVRTTTLREYAFKREKLNNRARSAGSLAFFFGPYFICFIMFFAFPLVLGIIMSMSSFTSNSVYPAEFVGFSNFKTVFTNPVMIKDFWSSVWYTIRFALIIVPLCIIIPLALAMLINLKPPGYKIFRACIYLPGIFPLTATGLILLRMFSYHNGFINALFDISVDWFGQTGTAWFMVGLFCIWGGIGGNFIIFCAGLENVDKSLYEASGIDGASPWKRFLYVTLPGIKPQLVMCIFTSLCGYMNLYGQNYILLSNTPDQDSVMTAVFRIQNMLLGSSRSYGYVAAMGIILGLIIAAISAVQMIATKERQGGNKRVSAFVDWKKSQ